MHQLPTISNSNYRFADPNQVSAIVDAIMNMPHDLVVRKLGLQVSEQVRDIVPVGDWLSDPYYVGDIARDMYPFWKDVTIEFCDGEFTELILTGAIGGGKSYCALAIAIRKLYELSCFKPVATYLGLASSSKILFAYLSISIRQAMQTGYGKILRMVDSIPYFSEHFPRDDRRSSQIDFLRDNVSLIPGSQIGHFRGDDLFGLVFDEGNFRQGGDKLKYQKAVEIYTESLHRRQSRFIDLENDKSFAIIVSSVDTVTSFTEERIKNAKEDPKAMTVHSTTWQTKPAKYSGETFWVFKGTEHIDPFCEWNVESLSAYLHHIKTNVKSIADLPAGELRNNWIKVPVEYRRSFKNEEIRQALADICGVAIGGIYRFFTARDKFQTAFPKHTEHHHPFMKQKVTVSFRTPGELFEYLRDDWEGFDPDHVYCAHIDQSLNGDRTGLAIAHAETLETGADVVTIDLVLVIDPPAKPDEISIKKIREFAVWLVSNKNLNLLKVTYDQFASAESIQEFINAGIDSERLSVDRTSEQYDLARGLIMNGKVQGYYYEPFDVEWFDLERDPEKRKVDHPASGSKDCTDAVVGAIWNVYEATNGLSDGMKVRFI